MADKDVSGKAVSGRTGATRRAFLSASAVTAVTVPLLGGTAVAATDLPAGGPQQQPDQELRALLRQVDPERIKATILRLVAFGTRHTASSQTDPVRGIGAATNWVFEQMQAAARPSGGRMTVQKQTFVQPVSGSCCVRPIPVLSNITTSWGPASVVDASAANGSKALPRHRSARKDPFDECGQDQCDHRAAGGLRRVRTPVPDPGRRDAGRRRF